jgi:hypothetical protein
MGMHQLRNARGEKLFQKGGKMPIEWGEQKTDARGGATPIVDEQLHAPKKTRPFATYPNTPAPKANEQMTGKEGPSRGRASQGGE